jgi:hypothetical protein
MKIFDVFSPGFWRDRAAIKHGNKEKSGDYDNLPGFDDFYIFKDTHRSGDSYFLNAWVNIAVGILIRNTARADFILTRNGNEITGGPTKP